MKCYIEEYPTESGGMGVRLREKETARRVEVTAFTQQEREEITAFTQQEREEIIALLVAPGLSGHAELLPNLYEPNGLADFVLVDGNVEVDDPELIRFTFDSALTYLIG